MLWIPIRIILLDIHDIGFAREQIDLQCFNPFSSGALKTKF